MRALIIESGKLLYREDLQPPTPRPGEVRVKVLTAGVCATDLAIVRGYMGFVGIPGHEFVGLALEGGFRGQRVVGEINAACGRCDACAQGLGRHCGQRTVLGILDRAGAFADELSLPEANLRPVPDSVSNDTAVFTEPLAAAFEITTQVDVRPGMRTLVAGDGRLGLLCAHVLHLAGAHVTVAGRHPERRDLLPPGVALELELLESPPKDRFDLAVEATGSEQSLPLLLKHVRPRGSVVLKTTTERPVSFDLAPLVIDEVTLIGSRCGLFEPALEALENGSIPVEGFITARYPLEHGVAALARAARPDALKVLIEVA